MIELIILDVDGCLSDGKIIYSSDFKELKSFSAKDGLGITTWKKMGKKIGIFTGRESEMVQRRAKELQVDYLFQNEKKKDEKLDEILKKESLKYKNVAAIGDDFNDLKLLKKVGLSFCPNDANFRIKDEVQIVLKNNGGDGAIREMIDYIVDRDGLTEEWFKIWL